MKKQCTNLEDLHEKIDQSLFFERYGVEISKVDLKAFGFMKHDIHNLSDAMPVEMPMTEPSMHQQ